MTRSLPWLWSDTKPPLTITSPLCTPLAQFPCHFSNSPLDIHGYPWINQMIPTGFGYGYSQSGMPPHSQPRRGGDPRFHIDFTSSSLRFHFDFTLISIRLHFDFTSDSLRFHIDFTSSSLRFHFHFTLISIRLHFDLFSDSRQFHFEFTSIVLRSHFDFTWGKWKTPCHTREKGKLGMAKGKREKTPVRFELEFHLATRLCARTNETKRFPGRSHPQPTICIVRTTLATQAWATNQPAAPPN